MFLSSILLGSGFYSNSVPIYAQENEAEIEASIEQENKCKKDTECKNENEINNSLTIITTQTQEEPETPTCETCFTDIMSQEELDDFITEFDLNVESEITTLEQLCEFIQEEQGVEDLNFVLLVAAQASISEEQYEALIECLQDVGLDVGFTLG